MLEIPALFLFNVKSTNIKSTIWALFLHIFFSINQFFRLHLEGGSNFMDSKSFHSQAIENKLHQLEDAIYKICARS